MSFHIGFVIETVVALLLLVSIGYSVVLDKRLRGLRMGEGELRRTIQDLNLATERAERAVESLRAGIEDSDAELTTQMRLAERRSSELKTQLKAGADLLARITRIVGGSERAAA